MPPSLAIPLASLLDDATGPVLTIAAIAVGIGGLLCLATDDDARTGESAQQVLGLAVGTGLALGLAHGLAAVVPSLVALG